MSSKRVPVTAVALSLAAAIVSGLSGSVPALARDDNTNPAAPAADRIGPETRLSLSSLPVDDERYQPAVVYNSQHDEYLVVWHRARSGGRDIVARRLTRSGELKSWFVVSTGAGNRAHAAVAYNGNRHEYLVVWMEDVSGDDSRWAIKGKIIPWDGPGSNPELTIADDASMSSREPSVAYSDWHNEYVVIWNTRAVESQTDTSVARRRVMANGSMPYARTLITTDVSPRQSDIAYNLLSDQYLVVWVRQYAPPPGGTGNDVWGSTMTYELDGSILCGAPFSITHSTKNEDSPSVSTNGFDRYIVVFEYQYSAIDRDIYGQELDTAGSKMGASPFPIAVSTRNETQPDVVAEFFGDWEHPDYFAAWQRTEGPEGDTWESIWARRWGSGATGHYFQVTPRARWDNWTPAVATDGVARLTAYAAEDLLASGGKRHIYGRIWWPAVVFVPLVLNGE